MRRLTSKLKPKEKSLNLNSRLSSYHIPSADKVAGTHSSTKSNSQTHSNKLPKDLWDRAYLLARQEPSSCRHIEAFEKILKSQIAKDDQPQEMSNVASNAERPTQAQLAKLIERLLKSVDEKRWKVNVGKHSLDVSAQLDTIAKCAIFAGQFVSSAVSTDPHASLAWAGVSVLLPLLSNPVKQQEALNAGLDYISSLICRLTTIERLYRRNLAHGAALIEDDMKHMYNMFESQIVKLYSRILVYEAQVVCQLARPSTIRTPRDAIKINDWTNQLAEIKECDDSCTAISRVMDSEMLNATLSEQDRQLSELLLKQRAIQSDLQQSQKNNEELQIIVRNTVQDLAIRDHRLEEIREEIREETEQSRLLHMLYRSDYEAHKARVPHRAPGTCQWFLLNKTYHAWLEDDFFRLLWVTADPGCGKSVLTKGLIDEELCSTSSRITCYFFFKEDDSSRTSLVNAFCAILHQYFCQREDSIKRASDSFRRYGERLVLSPFLLWNLLLEVTVDSASAEPVYCMLDALDECKKDEQQQAIKFLNEYQSLSKTSTTHIKFFVTSRGYFGISQSFSSLVIRLSGEDETEIIQQEIDLVIEERVVPDVASKLQLNQETQDALLKQLRRMENRTYLWLHLVHRHIESTLGLHTPKKIRQALSKLPKTVEDAYESLLSRSPDRVQAVKLLSIILVAKRPLTLRELNMAFNLGEADEKQSEVDLDPESHFPAYIKNVCGLFITIVQETVHLIHQTAKEFLLLQSDHNKTPRSEQCWKQSISVQASETLLAKICLRYLSFNDFGYKPLIRVELIYEEERKNIAERLQTYVFLEYAAQQWPEHFRLAECDDHLLQMWHYVCNRRYRRFVTWLAVYVTDDFRSTDFRYLTALDDLGLAAYLGHVAVAEEAWKIHCEGPYQTSDSWLDMAAENPHSNMTKFLLERGLGAEYLYRVTPLIRAVTKGHEKVVEAWLDVGIDPPDRNRALLKAVERGHCACAELLLQHNATLTKSERSDAWKHATKGDREAMKNLLVRYYPDLEEYEHQEESSSEAIDLEKRDCRRGTATVEMCLLRDEMKLDDYKAT